MITSVINICGFQNPLFFNKQNSANFRYSTMIVSLLCWFIVYYFSIDIGILNLILSLLLINDICNITYYYLSPKYRFQLHLDFSFIFRYIQPNRSPDVQKGSMILSYPILYRNRGDIVYFEMDGRKKISTWILIAYFLYCCYYRQVTRIFVVILMIIIIHHIIFSVKKLNVKQ